MEWLTFHISRSWWARGRTLCAVKMFVSVWILSGATGSATNYNLIFLLSFSLKFTILLVSIWLSFFSQIAKLKLLLKWTYELTWFCRLKDCQTYALLNFDIKLWKIKSYTEKLANIDIFINIFYTSEFKKCFKKCVQWIRRKWVLKLSQFLWHDLTSCIFGRRRRKKTLKKKNTWIKY